MSAYTRQSPSQTIGPMYGFALYRDGMDRSVEPGDSAEIVIEGLLLDGDGEPIPYPDALIELWQGDQLVRGRTDPFGLWRVYVRRPESIPELPDGRQQAPHLNVTVWARGLTKQAQTRVYFPAEEAANAADPILALVESERRDLLVAKAQDDGSLRFDISLQGERETVFFDF